MIFFIIFILLPSLILGLKCLINKGETNNRSIFSKFNLVLLFILIGVFLSTFILSKFNLYWSGYRSTSIIFICLTFTLIIFYLAYPIEKQNTFIVLLVYLSTFIFSGTAIFLSWEIYEDYEKQLFYIDNKYRLEETDRGIMRLARLPKLFVKNGVFERCYILDTVYDNPNNSYPAEFYIPKEKVINVKINEVDKHTVAVIIFHTSDTNRVRKNPIEFRVKL